MHIRDEHIRKETKTRMKRLFATRTQAVGPVPPLNTPEASASDPVDAVEVPRLTAPAVKPRENPGRGTFQELAKEQALRAAEDETDRLPVRDSRIIGRPVPLGQLFDFTDSHWVARYEKTARRSFQEELELYELLDLDAAGEEEVDVDLDDSTGDLMHG
jgi:hypothetical protein